jgi:hypothetical protein
MDANRVFFSGGSLNNKCSFAYNFTEKQLRKRLDMKEARSCHTLIIYLGGIYAFSGATDRSLCEIYDCHSNKWEPVAPAKDPLTLFPAVANV